MAVNKVYESIGFVNGKNGGTPLNGATTKAQATEQHIGNLNKIDYALNEIDTRVVEMANAKVNASSYATESKSWAIGGTDSREGEDTNNAKYYSDQAKASAQTVASETVAEVKTEMQGYVNSASQSVTSAEGYKNSAETFSSNAQGFSTLAKSYATGGTNTRENEDTDNAKYYCEQAKAIVNIPIATTTNVGTVKPDGTTISVDADGTIHVVSSGSPSASAVTYDNTSSGLESDDVQSAIDELDGAIATLGESVSNGKTLVANAITEKGVATSSTDSFSTMADNIADIKGGAEITIDGEPYEGEALRLIGKTLNQYIDISTLPYVFNEGSAVVLDNEIHILGGNKSDEALATKHYKWNGTEWTSVSTLPYRFSLSGAVVLDNEIHILGGVIQGEGVLSYHYKWNGTEWTSVSTLPYAFSGSAVVLDNEIHILGGRDESIDNRLKHYKWDGTSWTSVSTLPYYFTVGSAVVLDNEIHILGSSNGSKYHYKWDGTSWTSVSTLLYDFFGSSAVVFDNEIVVIGSFSTTGSYRQYAAKWDGTSWSYLSTMTDKFYYGSSVTFNEQVHVLGGGPYNDTKTKHRAIYGKWFMKS